MSYTYTPSEGAEVEEGALATRFVWQHTENVRKRSVTSLTPPWLGVDEYFVTKCIYIYILLFMVYIKNRKIAFSTHVSYSLPRGV